MSKDAKNKRKRRGFTLIEVVLAVGILAISAIIIIPAWQSFSDTVNLGNTAKMIETKVKLAKNYSLSARNDTNYGIHFETDNIVLFAGSVYAAGAPGNQIYNLPDNTEIYGINLNGGGADLVFNRLTGTTVNDGTIGLRITSRPARAKQASINSQGQTGVGSFQTSAGSLIANARHTHFTLTWNIQNSSDLILEWVDNVTGASIITNNIVTASYFNPDKSAFDWQGATAVSGVDQKIRIHSWILGGNSVICVMRDQTENEKLNIYFRDGIDKKIATYAKDDASGAVNVSAEAYGGTMAIQ